MTLFILALFIYLNLHRYSQVKKVALKVVAWYRLNFIIQSQDTSLIARFYNFRKKRRVDSITISARALHKYYGVDGIEEFVERGSPGFREYLPEIYNVQILDHQKYSSRVHELSEKFLMKQVCHFQKQLDSSNDRVALLLYYLGL